MACCLLHNFIRQEIPSDPFENVETQDDGIEDNGDENVITSVGTSKIWTVFRDILAQDMFESWNNSN